MALSLFSTWKGWEREEPSAEWKRLLSTSPMRTTTPMGADPFGSPPCPPHLQALAVLVFCNHITQEFHLPKSWGCHHHHGCPESPCTLTPGHLLPLDKDFCTAANLLMSPLLSNLFSAYQIWFLNSTLSWKSEFNAGKP